MKLGGQFRTSVRSIWAVGVSPKALSGGFRGGQSNFGENMVLAIKCLQISGWRKEIRVETKAWQLSAWQIFK